MREMGLVSGDLEQIDWAKPITDSVKDLVEALREFRRRVYIDIPDEDAERLRTVGDALQYLNEKVKA
mgnify:CR=1 FL=1